MLGVVAVSRHAGRANRRKSRPRQGVFDYARHCMQVWAAWWVAQDERGWPHESSEVRAFHRAQTKTVTDGIAAYRGRVEVNDDGKTVPKDPPPMPKETRASSRSRIPDIDGARLGPQVHRHLLDLCEMGGTIDAEAVMLWALETKPPIAAEQLGVSERDYRRHRDRALAWLSGRLSRH